MAYCRPPGSLIHFLLGWHKRQPKPGFSFIGFIFLLMFVPVFSCPLGYKQYKEKAWKTTKELDRHHTTRFEKHRHDLEVAQQLAVNREGWHRPVAQCVFDTG